MHFQQALTPDKPFFIYFATGATHAPHHVPKEWIAKYKGQFDQGWDRLRDATLARQIQLGVVPAGTKLTPRPAEIPAWEALTADQKRLFARQMETFAGFGEHTDYESGRLGARCPARQWKEPIKRRLSRVGYARPRAQRVVHTGLRK